MWSLLAIFDTLRLFNEVGSVVSFFFCFLELPLREIFLCTFADVQQERGIDGLITRYGKENGRVWARS